MRSFPTFVGRRRRLSRAIAEMHYQLRTEGDTPIRAAASIWVGVIIGCSPLYGLHLPMIVAVAKLFKLSRFKAYLAAHVNNPLTFPFLIWSEVAVGRWLFTGRWPRLAIDELTSIRLWDLGRDLFVGSLVLGVGIGFVLACSAFVVSARWGASPFRSQLKESVSRRYVDCGIVDWEFVRGKLSHDPVYYGLLRSGVLPDRGRLLDLGCGRGITLALLDTARAMHDQGAWAVHWPRPPRGLELIGVEQRGRNAAVARRALGGAARIERAELRDYAPPAAAVVLLIDVLHYIPAPDQTLLLERVACALDPGGLLLIREADADRGWRFHVTRAQERLSAFARGEWRRHFHYRGLGTWAALLEGVGLEVRSYPMWAGTPYANVLIEARKPSSTAKNA